MKKLIWSAVVVAFTEVVTRWIVYAQQVELPGGIRLLVLTRVGIQKIFTRAESAPVEDCG